MVYSVDHYFLFLQGFGWKWCTWCTIFPDSQDIFRLNGASRAPIFWVPGAFRAKIVHCVHQFPGFSLPQGSKWCTPCTVSSAFHLYKRYIGRLHVSFLQSYRSNGSKALSNIPLVYAMVIP